MKFGSVLKDHPEVLKKSKIYPNILFYTWHDQDFTKIPEKFDGREEWGTYLQNPVQQNCANSWSIVAKDILGDRLRLSTAGQLVVELSSTEIVSCIDKTPLKKVEGILSSQNIDYKDSCQGYSIYDAWEYIYANGVTESSCFSYRKLESSNIPTPDNLSFSEKIQKYGENCSNIQEDQTRCLVKKDGKYIARKIFPSQSIFNITGKDSKEKIRNIKLEILRFGPVAAGFLIYENFMMPYDGTTIYSAVAGKPLGGHYVSIVGWEKDYWICRNSWGVDWGLSGFFKIKMGIPEILLEENISACSPYVYSFELHKEYIIDGEINGKLVDITDMKNINPDLYNLRKKLDFDPITFYPKKTIKLIQDGKLYGNLSPLIKNPDELPNLRYYWVSDLRNFKYIKLKTKSVKSKESRDDDIFYVIFTISCIIILILGYMSKF